MSISTRTGDEGSTALLYGRRTQKFSLRVEAFGTVDEVNATLGLVRASTTESWLNAEVLQIQKELVALMGELAVAPEDTARYAADKHPKIREDALAHLDDLVMHMEKKEIRFEGWATPGDNPTSAALDLARTITRRAERRLFELAQTFGEGKVDPFLLKYINRLSDVLWLLARWAETPTAVANQE